MSNATVTIVMPVRNEAQFIERSLRSLLRQDYPSDRFEVIVADGMSDDGTRKIIRRVGSDRNVRVIDNPRRKGHEPFVRAAAFLPDVKFVLVGAWQDDAIDSLRAIASSNVEFAGRVNSEVLLDYYRSASVYVQPSLHEGFGLSVAEAMLAGCIPVTTRAGALPEVAGDHGLFVETTEPKEIADAIKRALTASADARRLCRGHILDRFPLAERGRQLQQLILSLTNGSN